MPFLIIRLQKSVRMTLSHVDMPAMACLAVYDILYTGINFLEQSLESNIKSSNTKQNTSS